MPDDRGEAASGDAFLDSGKVHVAAIRSRTGPEQGVVIEVRVDVVDPAQLRRIIDRVDRIPNVTGVRRSG